MEAVAIRRNQKGIITSMKNKAKLLLAISSLSAVVLAAGVTSTFAWFTTQSVVDATTGLLTVNSPATLKIDGKVVRGAEFKGADTTDYHLAGTGGVLGAVSSVNGDDFFAPKQLSDDPEAYATAEFQQINATATGNGYVGYLEYNIAVTAAMGEEGKHLAYTVTATPSGTQITNWYRVAVYYTGTASHATNDKIEAPEGHQTLVADSGNKVYGNGEGTDTAYYWNTEGDDPVIDTKSRSYTAVSGTSSGVACATAVETSVSLNVAAFFTVSVWMEGTAAGNNTQNTAANQTVSVTVSFKLI